MEIKETSYYHNSRDELRFQIPRDVKKICEIGCGEGSFRKHFPVEVEYIGVEPNAVSAKIAEKICNKILVGLFEDVEKDLPENYFDLIIANDVIEHSIDHKKFIDLIAGKIKQGSYFIGSIPNIRCFEFLYNFIIKKEWEYTKSGILDYTHLRYFTKNSLERTLKEAGFINIRIKPINRIRPNGSFKILKYIVIEATKIIIGKDIGYAQLAFYCEKGCS
jgi:2-polyprenyl-3-methyl-5-hydroxy-6-metoxy-1,4-benzoquinol methylase